MDPAAAAALFDQAAPTYDRTGVDFFGTFADALVAEAALSPGEHVLDVGCGRGAVLARAALAVGADGRAVGVDISPGMVRRTAADLADLPQVEVRQGDMTTIGSELGSFDAVLSSCVLFFADDPARVLQRWVRLVRPAGRLGLVTFVRSEADEVVTPVLRRYVPEADADATAAPSPFELVGDPSWLDEAITNAGMAVVSARETRHATRFADVDHWWAFALSTGLRQVIDALDADGQRALRDEIAAALDANRLPDGSLGYVDTVRLTIAEPAA